MAARLTGGANSGFYLSGLSGGAFSGGPGITVGAWFNVVTTTSQPDLLAVEYEPGATKMYLANMSTASGAWGVYDDSTSYHYIGGSNVSHHGFFVGKWVFAALSINFASSKAEGRFIRPDGAYLTTGLFTYGTGASDDVYGIYVGCEGSASFNLDGHVADLRVWRAALSPQDLMREALQGFPATFQSLYAYLPLERGTALRTLLGRAAGTSWTQNGAAFPGNDTYVSLSPPVPRRSVVRQPHARVGLTWLPQDGTAPWSSMWRAARV